MKIENTVKTGEPVYLTKNGYGSMVVLSIETYSRLIENVENALDAADRMAEETDVRYTHEEMFSRLDDTQYRLRYLPIFYDDVEEKVAYPHPMLMFRKGEK